MRPNFLKYLAIIIGCTPLFALAALDALGFSHVHDPEVINTAAGVMVLGVCIYLIWFVVDFSRCMAAIVKGLPILVRMLVGKRESDHAAQLYQEGAQNKLLEKLARIADNESLSDIERLNQTEALFKEHRIKTTKCFNERNL